MSIRSRFADLFGRKPASVQNVAAPIAAPKVEPTSYKATEALRTLAGLFRAASAQPTPQRSYKLPKPAPGVLPPGTTPRMAMDSQITASFAFGAEGYGWDGYGFMGYAYLSDLATLAEYRKPSEILANEMTRKWGKIISVSKEDKTELIKNLEDEYERLGVQEAFRNAFEIDNFFGQSKIYLDLGTKGDELKNPLTLDTKIRKGSLKSLKVIEPIWVYPNLYNSNNPVDPTFYKPQTWYVLGTEIHSTRLLQFCSRPVPDILKPAYMFGGVSLTQLLKQTVDNWLRTRQSVSDITHNFSTSVLKVDMGQMTTPGGAERLATRGQVFNTARDNLGLMILDMTKEDFVNVSAPISGLDKLQAQAQEQMAAIASIPLIKLFGITPSGLNASSDGEVRVFYDTIEAAQERVGTPVMRKLLEIVQMSATGKVDPDISWQWNPLWAMNEKEQAEVRKINAETDCAYVDHSILDAEEVRKTIAGEESSRFTSIEVEDVPEAEGDDLGLGGAGEGDEDARPAQLPHAGERRAA